MEYGVYKRKAPLDNDERGIIYWDYMRFLYQLQDGGYKVLWEDLRAICTRLSQPRLDKTCQITTPQTHLFALVHSPSHQITGY